MKPRYIGEREENITHVGFSFSGLLHAEGCPAIQYLPTSNYHKTDDWCLGGAHCYEGVYES